MTVNVQIDGTALIPQPRSVQWQPETIGGKLDFTDSIGGHRMVTLAAPATSGGTANFNWTDFENSVLTSIVLPPKGETMKSAASGTTYDSGMISKPIIVSDEPGDLIPNVTMRVMVVV